MIIKYSYSNEKCKELQNDDMTFCHVEGKLQKIIIGTITGLHP